MIVTAWPRPQIRATQNTLQMLTFVVLSLRLVIVAFVCVANEWDGELCRVLFGQLRSLSLPTCRVVGLVDVLDWKVRGVEI